MPSAAIPDLLLEVDNVLIERASEKNEGRLCYVCGLPCGAFLASRAAEKNYRIPVHKRCAEKLGAAR